MKTKYGVGIMTAVLVCVVVFSGMYYFSYQQAKNKQQAKADQLKQEQELRQQAEQIRERQEQEQEVVETEGDASKSDGYYLMERNGYIVVYMADKQTVYEYTNIAYSVLPEDVQAEISEEMYVETVEDLYSFLENYSS